MNDKLLHLIAFWSAWFASSQGCVVIHAGLREKLLELLAELPSSTPGMNELRRQAALLVEAESVGPDHPLNRAIFAFLVEHENVIPDEFRTNVDNIKKFFADRQP
jgi:hypothetical protein